MIKELLINYQQARPHQGLEQRCLAPIMPAPIPLRAEGRVCPPRPAWRVTPRLLLGRLIELTDGWLRHTLWRWTSLVIPTPPPSPSTEHVDFRADPYPFYRRLLDERPVSEHSEMGLVMVARYADIARLLRDPRLSSDDRNSEQHNNLVASSELGAEHLALLDQRSFMRRDAPDHTRLRRLVSKVFTPRSVEALRPGVQSLVDEAIDWATGRGRIELIAELAYPMPITTISRLLGIPAEDHLRIQSWSRAQLCCSFEASGTLPGEAQRQNCTVQNNLTAYFDDLITRRRQDPGDDLLSALRKSWGCARRDLRHRALLQLTRSGSGGNSPLARDYRMFSTYA